VPNASNSQVMSLLSCETQWKYAHHPAYNYEPVSIGEAITRGVIGHKALEFYYRSVMEGVPRKDAIKATYNRLLERSVEHMHDPDMSQMYSSLGTLLLEYFKFYDDELDMWEILGVEILLEVPEINFVGRADVVMRNKLDGFIVPWDHKFLYNFWPKVAIEINSQLPGYVTGLRRLFPGENVEYGMVNELRHREDATVKFQREYITPTELELVAVANNHTAAAERINRYKSLSREEVDRAALRTMVKYNCEYCAFWVLCKAQLEGQDTTILEQVSFVPNSYGYEDKTD